MSLQESTEPQKIAAARKELERKNTEELFAVLLEGEYDDDVAWEAVSVLRLRGTPEVFDLAKLYCASENPTARARGLSVLAQLGAGKPDAERPFIPESVSIAINHLQDSDPEAIRCAAWALSHLGTDSGVTSLIDLRNHPDPEVRQAVACCIELRKHPQAVSILIALMEDADEVVRDWATFSLGSDDYEQSEPQINAALHKRLLDTYEEARREAIWGLARRKDPIGLKLLLGILESEEWWSGDESTAEEVLDVESGTSLEELQQGLRNLIANIPAPELS